MITLPYLLRVLGPEKYGLLNFAAAFIGYFGVITDYGFNLSIPREISIHREAKEKISEIFSSVIIIKSGFFLFGIIVLIILTSMIPLFNANQEIYLLTYLSVLGQVLFPHWYFQGIERMHFISVISISIRACSVTAIFLFIKTAEDLLLLIFINGITAVSIGIVSLMVVFIKFSLFVKWQK